MVACLFAVLSGKALTGLCGASVGHETVTRSNNNIDVMAVPVLPVKSLPILSLMFIVITQDVLLLPGWISKIAHILNNRTEHALQTDETARTT